MSEKQQNKRRFRNVNGILLLDKPTGISSNKALQQVKGLLQAKKAGHTGSLDPLASGMLPLCFGEATKFSQFLLNADKRYIVTAKLGERTTTSDAEGEVVETRDVQVSLKQVEATIKDFTGLIEQIPSMFSALKHNGQPLYKLARKGIEVERPARQVSIFSMELVSFKEQQLALAVHCSKGTYIRTLIDDIGEALGCGAHVIQLHRISVGPYQPNQMLSMAEIERLALEDDFEALSQHLLPVDSSIQDWPTLVLSRMTAYYLLRGQAVQVPGSPTEGWVRLQLQNGQFIGVGEIMDDGRVTPKRLVAA